MMRKTRDEYGEDVLRAALAWNEARRELNRLRAEGASHRCTEASPYPEDRESPCFDPWVDTPAEATAAEDERCDNCKARAALREPIRRAKADIQAKRRRLQYAIGRLMERERAEHGDEVA